MVLDIVTSQIEKLELRSGACSLNCSLIMMSHQAYVIPFASGIGELFGIPKWRNTH
uniref:Uncharacterized protein n=1 Tax=Heterorhabditis bacteriophora TaxID=37862 RepID=A0A1I7W9A9_HETBA